MELCHSCMEATRRGETVLSRNHGGVILNRVLHPHGSLGLRRRERSPPPRPQSSPDYPSLRDPAASPCPKSANERHPANAERSNGFYQVARGCYFPFKNLE